MIFTDSKLDELRQSVSTRMKESRYNHTLGVENMATFLGRMLLPHKISELSAAALLHDIAKELPTELQVKYIKDSGKELTSEDLASYAVLHSFAAPAVIKNDFPDFATPDILSAVFNHTVGSPDMSVFDTIIFISDFAEEGRPYPACKEIAENIKKRFREGLENEEYIRFLNITMLETLDATVKTLKVLGKSINSRTLLTMNSFKAKI